MRLSRQDSMHTLDLSIAVDNNEPVPPSQDDQNERVALSPRPKRNRRFSLSPRKPIGEMPVLSPRRIMEHLRSKSYRNMDIGPEHDETLPTSVTNTPSNTASSPVRRGLLSPIKKALSLPSRARVSRSKFSVAPSTTTKHGEDEQHHDSIFSPELILESTFPTKKRTKIASTLSQPSGHVRSGDMTVSTTDEVCSLDTLQTDEGGQATAPSSSATRHASESSTSPPRETVPKSSAAAAAQASLLLASPTRSIRQKVLPVSPQGSLSLEEEPQTPTTLSPLQRRLSRSSSGLCRRHSLSDSKSDLKRSLHAYTNRHSDSMGELPLTSPQTSRSFHPVQRDPLSASIHSTRTSLSACPSLYDDEYDDRSNEECCKEQTDKVSLRMSSFRSPRRNSLHALPEDVPLSSPRSCMARNTRRHSMHSLMNYRAPSSNSIMMPHQEFNELLSEDDNDSQFEYADYDEEESDADITFADVDESESSQSEGCFSLPAEGQLGESFNYGWDEYDGTDSVGVMLSELSEHSDDTF